MSSLVTREREKYESVWSIDSYHVNSPGAQVLPVFLDMSGATPGATILDAGCGSAKGAVALTKAQMRVTMCDLTPDGVVAEATGLPFVSACLWDDLTPLGTFDYVYCCDVLEHIPTPFTMLVIARLLAVAKRGVFLSISTVPDNYGPLVGATLHQTVQPFVWWRDQLAAMGHLKEARDMLISGCYYVEPRR